ncbi:MAG TPA: hypothetical protein VGF24_22370 [Vicinamibacterales bacterium]
MPFERRAAVRVIGEQRHHDGPRQERPEHLTRFGHVAGEQRSLLLHHAAPLAGRLAPIDAGGHRALPELLQARGEREARVLGGLQPGHERGDVSTGGDRLRQVAGLPLRRLQIVRETDAQVAAVAFDDSSVRRGRLPAANASRTGSFSRRG